MKKVLSVLLCLLCVFSFVFTSATAVDTKSKTETFIESIPNGVGAKLQEFAEIYIKGDKAAVNLEIGPIKAKAVVADGKVTAYLFGICKADVTEIVEDFISIDDLTSTVKDLPKMFEQLNTDELFKYLKFDSSKSTATKEVFIPNEEEIKKLAVEKIKEQGVDLSDKSIDELIQYAKDNSADISQIQNLLNSKAEFTYDGNKLVGAVITFPGGDDLSELTTVDLFSEIGVEFITTDFDDSVFKSPFAILNVTWLVKLVYKFVKSKMVY